jgi:hypothetical protein
MYTMCVPLQRRSGESVDCSRSLSLPAVLCLWMDRCSMTSRNHNNAGILLMYARLAVPWSVDGLRRGSWVALQRRLGPFLSLGAAAEQRRVHDSPLLALLAPLCCCCCLIELKTQDSHSTPKSPLPSATCVLSCLLLPADCPSPPPYPSSRSKTPVLASQTPCTPP